MYKYQTKKTKTKCKKYLRCFFSKKGCMFFLLSNLIPKNIIFLIHKIEFNLAK
jgi:hypothetical protein